jgi:glycine/D-amino acid oxidase-like deaminating enzyme
MTTQPDTFRIIGQGLVGSLLALAMEEAGARFVVQSANLPGESTPIAPGIVNPLAGRKLRPPHNIDRLLQELHSAAARMQHFLGSSFWHQLPILRVFLDGDQAERIRNHHNDEGRGAFISGFFQPGNFPYLQDTFGSFLTSGGGWMDLPGFKSAVATWLKSTGRLVTARFDPDAAGSDHEVVIFCEGWQVLHNPAWSFIPHNPAKGQMLIVRFAEPLPRSHIINHYCWAQPFKDDLWRVGATYSWDGFSAGPSADASADLRERLELLSPIPFEVLDAVAGVRPIVEDYLPVIGRHPQRPNWFVLNAMGSKGVLQAPLAVRCLADQLLHDTPPPAQWAVDRFLA